MDLSLIEKVAISKTPILDYLRAKEYVLENHDFWKNKTLHSYIVQNNYDQAYCEIDIGLIESKMEYKSNHFWLEHSKHRVAKSKDFGFANDIFEKIFRNITCDQTKSVEKLFISYTKSQKLDVKSDVYYFFAHHIWLHSGYLEEYKGQERFALKRLLCKAYLGRDSLSEESPHYELVEHLRSDFLTQINNFQKQITKFLSFKDIEDFKKNKTKIFQFLRSFKFPFINNTMLKNIDVFLESINSILKNHPEEVGTEYAEYRETATQKLKTIIANLEASIDSFSASCLLLLAHKLVQLISQEYKSIEDTAHVELRIVKPDKKYRLKHIEETFNLELPIYYESGSLEANGVSVEVSPINGDLEIKSVKNEFNSISKNSNPKDNIATFEVKPINAVYNETLVHIKLSWRDVLCNENTYIEDIVLKNSSSEINWGQLRNLQNPYSLQAVERREDLIGREKLIDRIMQGIRGAEGVFITGQKRVGKTSIGKTLCNLLFSSEGEFTSYITAYISIGDIVGAKDPAGNLGFNILEELSYSFEKKRGFQPTLPSYNKKEFIDNFSHTISLIKSFHRNFPDLIFVIFLDEFDEIPESLFKGDSGDRFFLGLRALTEFKYVSLILIGGEKLPLVENYQGSKLNKLTPIQVDYFDINSERDDILYLIKYPSISTGVEISDNACNVIIDYSAGNPYYVMAICNYWWQEILREELSSSGATDIDRYIGKQVQKMQISSFQHFWEDGKIGIEEEVAKWGFYNSRVLIGISQLSSIRHEFVPINTLLSRLHDEERMSQDECKIFLDELFRRNVLIKSKVADSYKIRIKLFSEWLRIRGREEINLLYKNSDYMRAATIASKKYDLTRENYRSLEKRFSGFYREIDQSKIQNYLQQFQVLYGKKEAWLAFKILEKVVFFSRNEIEKGFKEDFRLLLNKAREVQEKRNSSTITRRRGGPNDGPMLIKGKKYKNIIVSRIDREGKSGAEMVRIFGMANSIVDENIVGREKILEKLKEVDISYTVVFVDDFVGTGRAACENFKSLFAKIDDEVLDRHYFYYCIICGFQKGISRINNEIQRLSDIICYKLLGETDSVFSEEAAIFQDGVDKVEARRVFEKIGICLEKKNPLGYENSQALVIFYDNAPNNTLPALIKEGKVINENDNTKVDWEPLFLRR